MVYAQRVLALLTLGLLFNLLLLALLIGVGVGVLIQFGYDRFDTSPGRCPSCGAQALEPRQPFAPPESLRLLACSQCGAEFREERDGRLSTVTTS